MIVNIIAAATIFTCVISGEIIEENEKNLNPDENEGKENNTVIDFILYPPQRPSYFDDTHAASHWSLHKDGYNKSYTADSQTVLPWDNSTVSSNPDAGNAFNETVESLESNHLELSVQNCSGRAQGYRVRGTKGSIRVFFTQGSDIPENTQILCKAGLQVPQGMVARVDMLIRTMNDAPFRIVKLKMFDEDNNVLYDDDMMYAPQTFVTYSSILNIQVEAFNNVYTFEILINFIALPETTRSQLYLNLTSPNEGFIEISKWSGNGSYFPFINTGLHLAAPKEHSTVLSIHFVDLSPFCVRQKLKDVLTLQTENESVIYYLCSYSTYTFTDPILCHGNVHVQYKGYIVYHKPSFKLAFSFHRLPTLPVRLSEYKWNCSAVQGTAIRLHFPCNFVYECVGGEDEAGCWPGSPTCSPETFQADGRCFSVVALGQKATWNLASGWCHQRGGLLPSLTTRKLWDSVTELFMTMGTSTFVFIGSKSAPPTISLPYRNSWLWSDGTVAHFTKLSTFMGSGNDIDACACYNSIRALTLVKPVSLQIIFCDIQYFASVLVCEVPATSQPFYGISQSEIKPANVLSSASNDGSPQFYASERKSAYIWCPNHHFTHLFLACDELSDCWSNKDGACSAPLTSLLPPFQCVSSEQDVPYTLVCDHRSDCKDGSDEEFCYFPPCDVRSPFRCSSGRCVQISERCNGQADCDDRADEDRCPSQSSKFVETLVLQRPLKVDLDSKGRISFSEYINLPHNSSSVISCPDSHFLCASLGQVCLPVYVRCNGIKDCPGHEDEAGCDNYTCPGFYRCRDSQVCVHESNVCDGVYQCPQRDDDILCDAACPENCVCHGWAFVCSGVFNATGYPKLRYCDGSRTGMTLAHLDDSTFLVHLSLTQCNLTKLDEVTLPNLRTLDLTNNHLIHINSKHFAGLTNLQFLKISFNPLKALSFQNSLQTSLKILDMSDVQFEELDFEILGFFSSLTTLNLSGSQIVQVTGQGFRAMDRLRILDLRLCPMTLFPRGIFKSLTHLETIYADNYKLCCPAALPRGFNVLNCHAPSDEVSSCDDLLRSNVYRFGFAVLASLALLGNLVTLVYRLIFHRTANKVGYDTFVTNLSMADFLMGLYLVIIGTADQRYKGIYLWEDVAWRNSFLCKLAGFTCLLSSEVSVFVIFFITCDRFLVVRFPLSQVHFGKRSAQFACALSWFAGFTLACIPLLPLTSHWKFYSQTSICIPLPTSRSYFPGRRYSFGVIFILNFIFFVFIFIGQIIIYMSVRANSVSAASKPIKEFQVARRLITVAVSDFLCWFPVGLTGILASYDIPIPGEVNVGIAIFFLPINAALNPFLYTINIYLERRRRAREEEKRKRIIAQLKFANVTGCTGAGNGKVTVTNSDALNLLKNLIGANILSLADLRGLVTEAR